MERISRFFRYCKNTKLFFQQLKHFWQQLLADKAFFSACGMCRIDRQLLTSVKLVHVYLSPSFFFPFLARSVIYIICARFSVYPFFTEFCFSSSSFSIYLFYSLLIVTFIHQIYALFAQAQNFKNCNNSIVLFMCLPVFFCCCCLFCSFCFHAIQSVVAISLVSFVRWFSNSTAIGNFSFFSVECCYCNVSCYFTSVSNGRRRIKLVERS